MEGAEPIVTEREKAHGARQPIDGARQVCGGGQPALQEGVVEGQKVEQQLHRLLRRAGAKPAVRQNLVLQRTVQAPGRQGQQAIARPARQRHPDDGADTGAFGGAGGSVVQAQQMPGLTRETVQHPQPLHLRGDGEQPPHAARQIEHPPFQHLRAPGEGRDVREHLQPVQGEAQGLAGGAVGEARIGDSEQVAQPRKAVKLHRKPARGAGGIPRVSALTDLQGRSGEVQPSGEQRAAFSRFRGTKVAGGGGEGLRR